MKTIIITTLLLLMQIGTMNAQDHKDIKESVIIHGEETSSFQIKIQGVWEKGSYNDTLKFVEPLERGIKKKNLEFSGRGIDERKTMGTERGDITMRDNIGKLLWQGFYEIDNKNGILFIEYRSFTTDEGVAKEISSVKQYKILKVTEKELILFDLFGFGDESSYTGYLKR